MWGRVRLSPCYGCAVADRDRSQPLLGDLSPSRVLRDSWYEVYQDPFGAPATPFPDALGRTSPLRWGQFAKKKSGLFEDFGGFGYRKERRAGSLAKGIVYVVRR